jgi:hypothetical protein
MEGKTQLKGLTISSGRSLLVVPPLIHPTALYHLKVPFVALLPFTGKARYLQYPFQKVGKTYPVNFVLAKYVAKAVIQFYGNVFVVVPVNGWLKTHDAIIGVYKKQSALLLLQQ